MELDERPFGASYPLGFLAKTAALTAVACAIGLAILRWFFFRELGTGFAPAFHALKGLQSFLVPSLLFCALAVLLLASAAVFAVAVFASHKVAGPLFRLQRVAGHLQRKVLVGHIHLRTADQGKPVARALNEWGTARKRQVAELRRRLARCRDSLRACEQDLAGGSDAVLSASVGELLRVLGGLESK